MAEMTPEEEKLKIQELKKALASTMVEIMGILQPKRFISSWVMVLDTAWSIKGQEAFSVELLLEEETVAPHRILGSLSAATVKVKEHIRFATRVDLEEDYAEENDDE